MQASIKSPCEHCRQHVGVRIQVLVDGSCWKFCGRCTIKLASTWRAKGFHVSLIAFWWPMVNPFCTGDGRYFANADEAMRQHRLYEARCRGYFRRVRRIYRKVTDARMRELEVLAEAKAYHAQLLAEAS